MLVLENNRVVLPKCIFFLILAHPEMFYSSNNKEKLTENYLHKYSYTALFSTLKVLYIVSGDLLNHH